MVSDFPDYTNYPDGLDPAPNPIPFYKDGKLYPAGYTTITTQGALGGVMPTTAGGTKHDQDKVRVELFPPDAFIAISEILTLGAKKYTDRNWEKGMKWSRVYGALLRHLFAWWGGKIPTKMNFLFGDLDVETGKSHLWHAGCCIIFLISYELREIGEDDRP